jgi:hypothetical protein
MLRSMFARARAFAGGIPPHQQVTVAWWVLRIVAAGGRPDRVVSATVDAVFDLNDDNIREEREKRPQPPAHISLG